MKFQKFPSLVNHYCEKDIGYFQKFDEYVVTEKIDGANFSIWVTTDEIKFARRSSFLQSDEKFFNWQSLLKDKTFSTWLDAYVNRIRTMMTENPTRFKSVILYGELFGQGIQKRINYGANLQFRAYDMHFYVVNQIDEPVDNITIIKVNRVATPWAILQKYVADENFLVPVIKEHVSFNEAMNIDTSFNSKLTPLDYNGDNLCEGVVIRPMWGFTIENSQNPNASCKYPVVKKKNPKFLENMGNKKVSTKEKLSDDVKKFVDFGMTFINENRIKSLLSKLGEMKSMSDFGNYIKEFNYDWQKDFYNEIDNITWEKLSKKDKKNVIKIISAEGIKLLKKEIMQ